MADPAKCPTSGKKKQPHLVSTIYLTCTFKMFSHRKEAGQNPHRKEAGFHQAIVWNFFAILCRPHTIAFSSKPALLTRIVLICLGTRLRLTNLLVTNSGSNWNLEVLVFVKGGKTRETLGASERSNNILKPHITPSARFELGPHWWQASALTTVPSLHSHTKIICTTLEWILLVCHQLHNNMYQAKQFEAFFFFFSDWVWLSIYIQTRRHVQRYDTITINKWWI